jgi:PAT family beta-lactamase induction signal transducer AmpG
MTDEKIDLAHIGLFSLVGIPYSIKFLWSPLMDRFAPTSVFASMGLRFGRRRAWILGCQMALMLGIIALAFGRPASMPATFALFALVVAFLSASQDIVIDAYRTDMLHPDERGLGSALHTSGYRLAMIFSGAFALILADQVSWQSVYLLMAGAMGVGILAVFFAPEPEVKVQPPRSLQEAVIEPFLEFFRRKGALEIVAFVVLYRLDVVIASALITPFLISLGFSKTDIGAVFKGFGFFATIAGTLVGGAWMMHLGMKKSLWTFGLLQGFSTLTFLALALVGYHYPTMIIAIIAENFFSGMGTSAYAAFLMSLCNPRYTATQYALLTSLMALTRIFGSAPTGYLATAVGWPVYFLVATALMVPGLLILLRYDHWTKLEVKA